MLYIVKEFVTESALTHRPLSLLVRSNAKMATLLPVQFDLWIGRCSAFFMEYLSGLTTQN